MPVYDYICTNCGLEKKDEFVHIRDARITCPSCGSTMNRQFPNRVVVHTFPPEGIHLADVSPTGETFHSKSEMERFAKANNMELGALL